MSAMSLDGGSDKSSSLSEVSSGQGDPMDPSGGNTNESPAQPKTMHKPRAPGFKAKPYQRKNPSKKAPPRKKQRTEADLDDNNGDDSGPEYTPRATTSRTRKAAETKNTPTKGGNGGDGTQVAHVGKRAVANLPEPHSTSKSRAKARSFAPSTVVTKSTSPLKSANLRNMLFNPEAWTTLSYDQQVELINDIPDGPTLIDLTNRAAVARFSQDFLRPNTAFQTDIRLFQEDLADGRFEKDWAKEAGTAMEQRASGKFDEWKLQEYEAFWGQKQRTSDASLAGDSASITLEEMVENELFRVGDVWEWCHTFKSSAARPKGSAALLIEKEAEIVRITDENHLVFRMAAGKAKFVHQTPATATDETTDPQNGEEGGGEDVEEEGKNIEVGPFSHPNNLCTAMMEPWGHKQRLSNAWKQIRIKRKNQDIGSPFEIRELYWLRKQGKAPRPTSSHDNAQTAGGDSSTQAPGVKVDNDAEANKGREKAQGKGRKRTASLPASGDEDAK